jgi:F0F1-type ATP synthase epsilon subunit
MSIPRIRGSQIELIATVFYFRLTMNRPRERESSKKREKTRRSKQREKRKKREKRRRRIKVFISYFSTFWFNRTC